MFKKILLGLAAALLLMQLIRPEKNLSEDNTYHVSTKYQVPDDVKHILSVACNDCHTNKTTYPWYAEIQPVAWWLNDHVNHGKKHYNLSTFTKLPIAVQNHKFEETIEMVEKKEMPLASYTNFGLHAEANLTDAQRQTLISWAKAQMDSLKANYPADSLKMKPRPGGPPK
jgi:Haem-binding domain